MGMAVTYISCLARTVLEFDITPFSPLNADA